MKKSDSSDEYYLLKHFSWLLYKHADAEDKEGKLFDSNRKKRFNKHFQKEMNLADLLDRILKIDEDLTAMYDLKTDFDDFYSQSKYDDAEDELHKLIKKFRKSSIDEMKTFSKTLSKWSAEIINSFIIVDNEYIVHKDSGAVTVLPKHMNNAVIERKNGILKLIKKASCGYRNWPRFRNRSLYVLRKNASYRLDPIDEPKARRDYKKNDSHETDNDTV